MLLDEPAVGGAGDAEDLGGLLGVLARLQAGGQNDHIHRDAALLADQGVFDLDDELALFGGDARRHR